MKLNLTKTQRFISFFTVFYIIAFLAYYLSIKNYEFLWYIAVVLFFFALILFTLNRSRFDSVILGGLSLWALFHMAGGGVVVNGDVLYAFTLIPIFEIGDSVILKFDQFVHAFGFGVSALVVYHLLLPYLKPSANWKALFPLIVVSAAGLGALNEVVEFIAVLSFPETGVGGYFNTSFDLVFNFLGAIIAVILIKVTGYKKQSN